MVSYVPHQELGGLLACELEELLPRFSCKAKLIVLITRRTGVSSTIDEDKAKVGIGSQGEDAFEGIWKRSASVDEGKPIEEKFGQALNVLP